MGAVIGTASDSLGTPLQRDAAITLGSRSDDRPRGPWRGTVGPDGGFRISGVPPGDYHLITK